MLQEKPAQFCILKSMDKGGKMALISYQLLMEGKDFSFPRILIETVAPHILRDIQ